MERSLCECVSSLRYFLFRLNHRQKEGTVSHFRGGKYTWCVYSFWPQHHKQQPVETVGVQVRTITALVTPLATLLTLCGCPKKSLCQTNKPTRRCLGVFTQTRAHTNHAHMRWPLSPGALLKGGVVAPVGVAVAAVVAAAASASPLGCSSRTAEACFLLRSTPWTNTQQVSHVLSDRILMSQQRERTGLTLWPWCGLKKNFLFHH